MDIATGRVGAELLDLEAGGLLPSTVDPVAIAEELPGRYGALWDAIPPDLVGRLEPAEVFHEVLEHRWFRSERAGRDMGTRAAARSSFATVRPQTPREVTTPSVIAQAP